VRSWIFTDFSAPYFPITTHRIPAAETVDVLCLKSLVDGWASTGDFVFPSINTEPHSFASVLDAFAVRGSAPRYLPFFFAIRPLFPFAVCRISSPELLPGTPPKGVVVSSPVSTSHLYPDVLDGTEVY